MLEVGGGLGVLSEYLAERVAHVHVVEIDRGLETAAARRAGAAPEHDAALRRRREARPRSARPRAHQGRRQPALRRGRHRDHPHDRAALGGHVGGDGAEGGRRALRGRPVDLGLRRALGARAARVRRAVGRKIPRNVFFPVPNVDSVLVAPGPPLARAARTRCAHSSSTASRTAARRSASRWRSRRAPRPASATAPARPWRRWASPPTPAPRRSAPPTGARCGSSVC